MHILRIDSGNGYTHRRPEKSLKASRTPPLIQDVVAGPVHRWLANGPFRLSTVDCMPPGPHVIELVSCESGAIRPLQTSIVGPGCCAPCYTAIRVWRVPISTSEGGALAMYWQMHPRRYKMGNPPLHVLSFFSIAIDLFPVPYLLMSSTIH